MSKDSVNVGFLGVGALAAKQHVPNAFHNPLLRVHTLCDLDAARLKFYQDRYKPQRVTTDYREMLADPEVELRRDRDEAGTARAVHDRGPRSGQTRVRGKAPGRDDRGRHEGGQGGPMRWGAASPSDSTGDSRPPTSTPSTTVKADKGPLLINYRMVDDARDRSAWYAGRIRLIDEACHVFDVFNWLARSEPVGVYATEFGRKEDNQVVVRYENGVTAAAVFSSFGAFGWPKERVEIVGDNKVVAVEDFVELQAAGVPGLTQKNYAGREYDGFTHGYAQAYAQIGLPMYRYMRRLMEQRLHASGLLNTAPTRNRWEAMADLSPQDIHIPVNYSCDKGWYNALDHFGRSILQGSAPGTASAQDAAKAIEMGLAALESIRTGQPVR